MTLVVSEISRYGVAIVGDSAVTRRSGANVWTESGASKVLYSSKLNLGFAIWGRATVSGTQLDIWLNRYLDSLNSSSTDIDTVAEALAATLAAELMKESRPWSELRCGIQVTGYKDALPRLWHIHCGHPNETPHEPRVYRDYPEEQGWTEDYYRMVMLSPGGTFSCHLRNGYTLHYALLHEHIVDFINKLRGQLGIAFPQDTLGGHLEFHKVLVRFVAGLLIAAGEHPGVNDQLSALAFNENGIAIDERLPMVDWLKAGSTHSNQDAWFSSHTVRETRHRIKPCS